MKLKDIDKIIKKQSSLSEEDIDELYRIIRSEPLKFLFSGKNWLYFLILSLIPFIVVIKTPNTAIAEYLPFLDPVSIKILAMIFFINKESIHFVVKIVMVNWSVTKLYHATSRPLIKYRTVRIALLVFIAIALTMRFA